MNEPNQAALIDRIESSRVTVTLINQLTNRLTKRHTKWAEAAKFTGNPNEWNGSKGNVTSLLESHQWQHPWRISEESLPSPPHLPPKKLLKNPSNQFKNRFQQVACNRITNNSSISESSQREREREREREEEKKPSQAKPSKDLQPNRVDQSEASS